MYKKLFAVLLSSCMVISLAGCGSGEAGKKAEANTGGSTETDKKVITFYTWASDANQVFNKNMVAEYEKNHPNIDIDDNYIPYAEYLSKINTMAAADSMPDIFNVPEGNVYEWGEKGAVLDLKPLYEEAGIDPYDISLSATIYATDDNIWSVGYDVATMCLFYNKDLFKENNIEEPSKDPQNPISWTEFVETAKKLTKDVNGKTPDEEGFDPENVQVYGTKMMDNWAKFIPLLHSNGAGIANADGTELSINTEKGIEVIQSIADLSLKEHCAPGAGASQGAFADDSAMLMNGQLAMTMNGGWALSNYMNEGFDVGVAAIPAFETPANISWTAGLCMSPNAKDNKEAFEFYQYFTNCSNSIDAAISSGVSLGGLPCSTNVFDGGENQKKWVSTYAKVDATEACETIKNILFDKNNTLRENVLLKNFPTIVETTLPPILDPVWLGEMTAEEALAGYNVSSQLDGVWKVLK